MGKQTIIAISREFGSGGRVIAEKIAKDLGLPLLDRNILEDIAAEMHVKTENFKGCDESVGKPFLTRRVRGHSNSMEEALANLQFAYLKKRAEKGESFVVVGRCAGAVLSGMEGLTTVFVLGDRDCKKARVMERYHLSEEDALAKMNRHDKKRKQYHNTFSKTKWGDSRGYDLCVNSSKLGIDKTAELIEHYVKSKDGE